MQIYFLEIFARLDRRAADKIPYFLHQALENGDIDQAVDMLKELFSHIPYQLHINQEKFYHALLQIVCSVAGIKAQSEYSTSLGRIDLVLDLPSRLYVVEIKFNIPANSALSQIEKRRYYERFASNQKPVILLGLSFRREPQIFDVTYAQKQVEAEN